MNLLTKATETVRSPGDPKVLKTGPSSMGAPDRLARALGWFSIGLGLAELLAAPRMTRALGMEGKEALVRGYGAREFGSGVLSLSLDKTVGIWSRVAGDALDIATLATVYRNDNPQKRNVGLALAAVVGVMAFDVLCAQGLMVRHKRGKGQVRDYSDRSGWPQGLERARGAARDFQVPADMRAAPMAGSSPVTGETSPASTTLQ